MTPKLKLTFCGGVGAVTGANFLLEETADSGQLKILVDCGLVQGSKFADDENRKPFLYDSAAIQYLFVTHAHIDHIGRVPLLVARGFKGKIISTPETKAIAALMFDDALNIMEEECRKDGTRPLYERKDAAASLGLWDTISYRQEFKINDAISVSLKDAGHILGSAMYEFTVNSGKGKKIKIVFTGDLGNSPTPILRDTETITDASYLVMESVYGDRNHENKSERRERLKQIINETVSRKGALLIPTFSVEKTQVLLYEMHSLMEEKAIPEVPVFLDSPLAIKVTEIYRKMRQDFNETARNEEAAEGDIFKFPRLHFTGRPEESRAIERAPSPKIILAGSGMSNGGRIIHHEKIYLSDSKNAIVFVGYQVAGSLGRLIQDGAKEAVIEGSRVPIKAKVETIDGYSSHKDSEHLVRFVESTASTLKKVFVVMGEPKSALFLAQRLREYLDVTAVHPEFGQSFELEF